MNLTFSIFDGYLIINEGDKYHITDEVSFNEYYNTYDECVERIFELIAEEGDK